MIVVPHNVIGQWGNYLEYQTNLTFFEVCSKNDIEILTNMIEDEIMMTEPSEYNIGHHAMAAVFSRYEVILVKGTMYPLFISKINSGFGMSDKHSAENMDIPSLYICWSRLIIDEVNSINLPNNPYVCATFTWFITSSITDLFCGRFRNNGFLKEVWGSMNTARMHNHLIYGPKNEFGIPSRLFTNDGKNICSYLAKMIVRCTDKYIYESKAIEQPVHCKIICEKSIVADILHGLTSPEVLEKIYAGDVMGAVNMIGGGMGVEQAGNIIKTMTKKLETNKHNKELELEFKKNYHYSSETAKEEVISKLEATIESINTQIKSIQNKIQGYKNELCPICYCEYENPVVLGCHCNSIFCFGCITASMKSHKQPEAHLSHQVKNHNTCPMCRGDINKITLISDSQNEVKKKEDPNDLLSKIDMLTKIITESPDKRFLVFSTSEASFDKICKGKSLFMYEGIQAAVPKGTSACIRNIIEKFTNNEIKILFLNTNNFGYGLNLHMADEVILFNKMFADVEKQAIGRANRIGRTKKLKVTHLLHSNE